MKKRKTNLKEKVIYEDLYLMSTEKEQSLIHDYFDGCEEDMEGLTEDQIRDRINDWNNSCYEDDFGPEGNWYYSELKNTPVVLTGTLGLWNGRHKIYNTKCDNLDEALDKILNSDIEHIRITEDRFGNLRVYCYHHDGTNEFVIKKWTPNGMRCLNFCKTVFGN